MIDLATAVDRAARAVVSDRYAWREQDHPRDAGGQFSEREQSGEQKTERTREQPNDLGRASPEPTTDSGFVRSEQPNERANKPTFSREWVRQAKKPQPLDVQMNQDARVVLRALESGKLEGDRGWISQDQLIEALSWMDPHDVRLGLMTLMTFVGLLKMRGKASRGTLAVKLSHGGKTVSQSDDLVQRQTQSLPGQKTLFSRNRHRDGFNDGFNDDSAHNRLEAIARDLYRQIKDAPGQRHIQWSEEDHPRDAGGQFSEKEGGSDGGSPKTDGGSQGGTAPQSATKRQPRKSGTERAPDTRAYQVKQYVAMVRGDKPWSLPFQVFMTGDDQFYYFQPMDPTGTWAQGDGFPVRKKELKDDIRKALAHGWGNFTPGIDKPRDGSGTGPGRVRDRSETGAHQQQRGSIRSKSGRHVSDPPRIRTDSARKTQNDLKKLDRWLIDNAIAEAEVAGDDFNLLWMRELQPGKLTTSDKDGLNLYLFDRLDTEIVAYSRWEETKHPRDAGGRFSESDQPGQNQDKTRDSETFDEIGDLMRRHGVPEEERFFVEHMADYYQEHGKEPKVARMLAVHDFSKREQQRQIQENLDAAGDAAVVEMKDSEDPSNTTYIIHPSARGEDYPDWQLSRVAADGTPLGHDMWDSREEAIRSVSGEHVKGPPWGTRHYRVTNRIGKYARDLPGQRKIEWNEEDHPRDDIGQFSEKEGGGAKIESSPLRSDLKTEGKPAPNSLPTDLLPVLNNAPEQDDPAEAASGKAVKLKPLAEYDRFLVQFSGGKDSLATVLHLIDLGVPRDKIELWHQKIDGEGRHFMDWPVTEDYVRKVADHLGVKLRFQWKEGGFEGELTREDEPTEGVWFEDGDGERKFLGSKQDRTGTRLKFPAQGCNLGTRWCSAYLKIDVAARAISNDPDLKAGDYLFVTGERREEGGRRSQYLEAERHRTDTKLGRTMHHWRPVIDWSEQEVWDKIREHGINPHPAYRLGYGRLSCQHCIFADRDQIASNMELDPEGVQVLADYEQQFGHTISHVTEAGKVRQVPIQAKGGRGKSFVSDAPQALKDLAMSTEYTDPVHVDDWQMPAGAFKRAGGPGVLLDDTDVGKHRKALYSMLRGTEYLNRPFRLDRAVRDVYSRIRLAEMFSDEYAKRRSDAPGQRQFTWREEDHPRESDGTFAEKEGPKKTGGMFIAKAERLTDMIDGLDAPDLKQWAENRLKERDAKVYFTIETDEDRERALEMAALLREQDLNEFELGDVFALEQAARGLGPGDYDGTVEVKHIGDRWYAYADWEAGQVTRSSEDRAEAIDRAIDEAASMGGRFRSPDWTPEARRKARESDTPDTSDKLRDPNTGTESRFAHGDMVVDPNRGYPIEGEVWAFQDRGPEYGRHIKLRGGKWYSEEGFELADSEQSEEIPPESREDRRKRLESEHQAGMIAHRDAIRGKLAERFPSATIGATTTGPGTMRLEVRPNDMKGLGVDLQEGLEIGGKLADEHEFAFDVQLDGLNGALVIDFEEPTLGVPKQPPKRKLELVKDDFEFNSHTSPEALEHLFGAGGSPISKNDAMLLAGYSAATGSSQPQLVDEAKARAEKALASTEALYDQLQEHRSRGLHEQDPEALDVWNSADGPYWRHVNNSLHKLISNADKVRNRGLETRSGDARMAAVGAVSGSPIKSLEEAGYEIGWNQDVGPSSDGEYWDAVGIFGGGNADRLRERGLAWHKPDRTEVTEEPTFHPVEGAAEAVRMKNGDVVLVEPARASEFIYNSQQRGEYESTEAITGKGVKTTGDVIDLREPRQPALPPEPEPPSEKDLAKWNKSATKLRDLSGRIRERGEEKLNQDRLENTARRARIAEGARSAARDEITIANTLDTLADHVESGTAIHLAGITNRQQVETLEHALRQARHARIRSGEMTWDEHERNRPPASEDDIRHATMVWPSVHRDHVKEALSSIEGKPGSVHVRESIGPMLARAGDDWTVKATNTAEVEALQALGDMAKKHGRGDRHSPAGYIREELKDYKRLRALGADTDDDLRETLREYLPLRGQRPKPDAVRQMERELIGRRIPGFFPTTGGVITRMMDRADIQPGQRVLEPSAGKGDIMDAVKARHPRANLSGIEINSDLYQILKAKGHETERGDFLQHTGQYDRILMNPPFEKGADADHVRHAYDQLAPGGRLVAIMGRGSFFRSDRKAREFREWLDSVGGDSEELPEKSFAGRDAFRQTGVSTNLVVIEKPAAVEKNQRLSDMLQREFYSRGYPDRYATWNELQHPRAPRGTKEGGRFVSSGQSFHPAQGSLFKPRKKGMFQWQHGQRPLRSKEAYTDGAKLAKPGNPDTVMVLGRLSDTLAEGAVAEGEMVLDIDDAIWSHGLNEGWIDVAIEEGRRIRYAKALTRDDLVVSELNRKTGKRVQRRTVTNLELRRLLNAGYRAERNEQNQIVGMIPPQMTPETRQAQGPRAAEQQTTQTTQIRTQTPNPPPGVAGEQMGLFPQAPGGQGQLFNVVPRKRQQTLFSQTGPPNLLQQATPEQRQRLSDKPTLSPADLGVHAQSPSKRRQKSLFSKRLAQALQREFYARGYNTLGVRK